MILLACLGMALLPPLAAAQPGGAPGFAQPPAQLWGPLNPGQASVSTAAELLQALEQNVGEIILLGERGVPTCAAATCAPMTHGTAPILLAPRSLLIDMPCQSAGPTDDIKLTAQDWSKYEPPILIQGNGTTWIHSGEAYECSCPQDTTYPCGGAVAHACCFLALPSSQPCTSQLRIHSCCCPVVPPCRSRRQRDWRAATHPGLGGSHESPASANR